MISKTKTQRLLDSLKNEIKDINNQDSLINYLSELKIKLNNRIFEVFENDIKFEEIELKNLKVLRDDNEVRRYIRDKIQPINLKVINQLFNKNREKDQEYDNFINNIIILIEGKERNYYIPIVKEIINILHEYYVMRVEKYIQLIKNIRRLARPMYNLSIKRINLEKYKGYYNDDEFLKFDTNKYNNYPELNNKIKNEIDTILISYKDGDITSQLLKLLYSINSIEVVEYFTLKIEKDMIVMQFKNKIDLYKKKQNNLTNSQINYLKMIINEDISFNINDMNEDIISKVNKYILSKTTGISDIFKFRKNFLDIKTGNGEKKIYDNILIIVIILIVVLLIILISYSIYLLYNIINNTIINKYHKDVNILHLRNSIEN